MVYITQIIPQLSNGGRARRSDTADGVWLTVKDSSFFLVKDGYGEQKYELSVDDLNSDDWEIEDTTLTIGNSGVEFNVQQKVLINGLVEEAIRMVSFEGKRFEDVLTKLFKTNIEQQNISMKRNIDTMQSSNEPRMQENGMKKLLNQQSKPKIDLFALMKQNKR